MAVPGDTVTISLTASEKVLPPIVLVESRALFARPTNTGGNSWDMSYTVNSRDPLGKVDYLITLTDASGNIYLCTSAKLLFQIVPRCQTTDGSSVTVQKNAPPPPQDTQAPVIAPHDDVTVASNDPAGIAVAYAAPTATDNVDGADPVTCTPASGSSFAFGTTTVTCSAQDAAGNFAVPVTFDVGVYFIPQPYVMASQPDESFLCSPSWESCFTGGAGQVFINLGLGSGLGGGTLLSVTIAKDETSPFVSFPWILRIECFTDAVYSTHCPDWVQSNSWNGFTNYFVTESSDTTTDNKHWTASYTNPLHEANPDGSSPIIFNPSYYYRLVIDDGGFDQGAYGNADHTLPYFVITGMTR